MKYISMFFLLSTIGQPVLSQTKQIEFMFGTWEEVKFKALQENKMIFVDAYTTWCSPCKKMDKEVFTNDSVADIYNSNFINFKIDMEKGEGKELSGYDQWWVQAFPSYLYFTTEGEQVHRAVGYHEVQNFIQLGQDALSYDNRIVRLIERYKNGERTPEFMLRYIKALKNSGKYSWKDVAAEYVSALNDSSLFERSNWELVRVVRPKLSSPVVSFIEGNYAKFEALYGKDEAGATLGEIYADTLGMAMYLKRGKNYDATKHYIRNRSKDNIYTEQIISFFDMLYYERKKDWKNYAQAALTFFDIYENYQHAEQLNAAAWLFFKYTKDEKKLLRATEWAKMAVNKEESPENLDTYANLLFVTGNKQEAIEKEKRAIELVEEQGDKKMVVTLTKNLKKFEK